MIDVDATLVTAHSEKEPAGADVQARLRLPSAVGVRRPRRPRAPGSRWRSCCGPGTPAPTPPPTTSPCSAPRWPSCPAPARPAGPEGAGPRRRRRRHPRAAGLADPPRLSYSVGFTLPGDLARPSSPPSPSRRGPRPTTPTARVRDGAWVAELTGLLDLTGWPPGMRVIVRKERPHPGAQLRITDVDGHRITAFATNTTRGPARRPGAAAPPPGPRRGPHPLRQGHRPGQPAAARLRQNQIWCAIVALACELTAWTIGSGVRRRPTRRTQRPKRSG